MRFYDFTFGEDPADNMLVQQMLVHGAGTSALLMADPVKGGRAGVENTLIEATLTPEQLAAKRALDAQRAEQDRIARINDVATYLRTKKSVPIDAARLKPEELLAAGRIAFPAGTYLRAASGGVPGIPDQTVWWLEDHDIFGPSRRHVLTDTAVTGPVIAVDPYLIAIYPNGVDMRTPPAMTIAPIQIPFMPGPIPVPVTAQPMPLPAPMPAPIVAAPPPPASIMRETTSTRLLGFGFDYGADPGVLEYVVKSGDTLTGIALNLGLCSKGPGNTRADWADCLSAAQHIADVNGLDDPNMIQVGQKLFIPMPVAAGQSATPASPWYVPETKTGIAGWLVFYGIAGFLLYKAWR